jgi:hypothetical protein
MDHLDEIKAMPGMEGVKITLVLRSPNFPDGRDIILTNDDPADAASALMRSGMGPGFIS